MSDYSWMKKGVLAITCNSRGCQSVNGVLVEIDSEPFDIDGRKAVLLTKKSKDDVEAACGVRLADDLWLHVEYLRPLRDDSQQLVSWESIAKDIGVDIRRVREVV